METERRPRSDDCRSYRRTAKNDRAWNHAEGRHKVTLRDLRAFRWALAQIGQTYTFRKGRYYYDGNDKFRHFPRRSEHAQIAKITVGRWAYFMSTPVDMPRDKTRDQVHGDAKKLASKTAKYLTLSSEYAARRTWAKTWAAPIKCSITVSKGAVDMSKWPGPGRARVELCNKVESSPARPTADDWGRHIEYREAA